MLFRSRLTVTWRLLGRWLPPLGWMAVIYFLSTDHLSYPEVRRTWTGFFAAKVVHLTEYAVLSLLWYRGIGGKLCAWNLRAAILSFAAASIYAVLDELHQSFTVYRGANFRDVLLDSFGAMLSMLALWLTLRLCTLFAGRPLPAGQQLPPGR
jgi:VanZ like family